MSDAMELVRQESILGLLEGTQKEELLAEPGSPPPQNRVARYRKRWVSAKRAIKTLFRYLMAQTILAAERAHAANPCPGPFDANLKQLHSQLNFDSHRASDA